MRSATLVALVAAFAMGCGGGSSDAERQQAAEDLAAALGGAVENAAAAAAPSGGMVEQDLPKFGLKITLPAGATVGDAIVGEGHMITNGVVLTITPPNDFSPETLEAAKEAAQMFTPTNIQEETLPDGWLLTYENTGGMGTNYFTVVRRTIGDKTVMCEGTNVSAEQQAGSVAACRSIAL